MMIEIKGIDFSYPKSGSPALRGVSASIAPGIHLLAGENGSGKTTLLHLIAGLRTPTFGSITIDGADSETDRPEEMGRVFLLEENQFLPGKTIRELADLHSRFYPNFSKEAFDRNLQAFGLTGHENLQGESLGRTKKAQLAYVLALGTPIVLLDEPTNALDIEGRETLRRLIASTIEPEQTMIVSTHSVADLENLFDGILILNRSQLILAATAEEIESRLAFRNLMNEENPDILYSEKMMGITRAILPADPDRPTAPDWRMLYSALHSAGNAKVMEELHR